MLDLFQRDQEIASRPSIEERVNNYIYGDALMYEPTLDLFREWLLAVLEIVFISVAAGAAMAAIFKGGLLGFKSWWDWLRAD
jgi:hypothetical protein